MAGRRSRESVQERPGRKGAPACPGVPIHWPERAVRVALMPLRVQPGPTAKAIESAVLTSSSGVSGVLAGHATMRGPGYLTVLRLRSKFCAALSPPRINLRLKGIHRPQFFVDLSVYGGLPSFPTSGQSVPPSQDKQRFPGVQKVVRPRFAKRKVGRGFVMRHSISAVG